MVVLRGKVLRTYKDENGKKSITLALSDSEAKKAEEEAQANECKDTPVSIGDDGTYIVRAHSAYPVQYYDNGEEVDEKDYPEITEIGEDSTVEIAANIKTVKYRGKSYTTAYLIAVNMIDIKEAVRKNPFAD